MFYALAAVLVVSGLVILVFGLRRAALAAGRYARTSRAVNTEVNAAKGMLRARRAALRIAVRDRRAKKTIGTVTEG